MKKTRVIFESVIGIVLGLSVLTMSVYAEDNGEIVMYDPNIVSSEDANDELPEDSVRTMDTAQLAGTISGLDESKIGSIGSAENIIFNDSANGAYFVMANSGSSGYNVVYYDMTSGECKSVYSVAEANKTYSDDTGAYFMYGVHKWTYDYDAGKWNVEKTYTFYKYDFDSGMSSEITLDVPDDMNGVGCFGVDASGRIYVASCCTLYLFDSSGNYLNSVSYTGSIGEFYGFDSTNGNFYYRGSYNWVYWGYDHDMASLMAGNVDSSNNIKITEGNIVQLFQSYWYEHEHPVAMVNGKYLAVLSTFSSEACVLLDSNSYDYTDVTEQSTTINFLTSDVSVSLVNISNQAAIAAAVTTASSSYGSEDNVDQSSIGPRCDVNKDGTSLIAKTDTNTLTEYDISTGEEKLRAETTYSVYSFGIEGDKCVVVEKDGDSYYIESFDWTYPTTFSVSASQSLTVGGAADITCSAGDNIALDYTYESSASDVVSVDANGRMNAWKKGTATITVTAAQIGASQSFVVTVEDSELSKSGSTYNIVNAVGTTSANMHVSAADDGSYSASVKNSYLTQLSDGHFERVEYVKGKIVIEEYDSSYNLLSVIRLKKELEYFGGFYSGGTYNYLVFGQANTGESDSVEVFRIVKYSKEWERLGACSVNGANTYYPFDAGTLDMTETGDKLYVYTCHTMYSEGDGLHHQANCTFVVNESDMTLVDSYYDVMDISYGYVSHSFAQQIETDGSYIYRADLGDAYPRGIAFTVTDVNNKIYNPDIYGTLVKIPGDTGDNYTGFTLSDMKLSANNYLIVGTGLKSSSETTANIYICTGDKSSPTTGATWLTDYSASSKVTVYSPKLVKLTDTQFLMMWEEKNSKTNKYSTRMVLIDEAGTKASKIYTTTLALSECDPIVTSSGKVVWYVTNNDSPIFVEINPYNLAKVVSKAKKDKTFKTDNTDEFSNVDTDGYSAGDVVISSGRIFKLESKKTVSMCGVVGTKTKITVPQKIKIENKTYKVTSIGQRAFMGQTKLKKVIIGKNVKTIGAYAFYGCKALKSVSMGKNVKTIEKYAFYSCKSLKSITIPSKVSRIGTKAFAKCKKLKTITIKSTKLTSGKVGTAAIKGIYKKAVIKAPAAKLSAYKKILLKKGATKKMKFDKIGK